MGEDHLPHFEFAGKLPVPRGMVKVMAEIGVVTKNADKIYKYMNFDQIEEYAETAKGVSV